MKWTPAIENKPKVGQNRCLRIKEMRKGNNGYGYVEGWLLSDGERFHDYVGNFYPIDIVEVLDESTNDEQFKDLKEKLDTIPSQIIPRNEWDEKKNWKSVREKWIKYDDVLSLINALESPIENHLKQNEAALDGSILRKAYEDFIQTYKHQTAELFLHYLLRLNRI